MTTPTSTITDATSIANFNRGPIPTIFSAPTSCLSTLSSVPGGGLYFGHDADSYWDPACYPSSTTTATVANTDAAWNLYYYSPAVSCPSGWYTAEVAQSTFGGVQNLFLTIGSATTVVLCCPSGYTAVSFQHQCQSAFQPGADTIIYKQPSQDINGNWIVPSSLGTVIHTVTDTADWTVFGDGIPIWYQAEDQVAFTAPKTSSQSSPASSTSSPSQTGSTSPSQSPTGLSTGAKAGIGVGVALGVVALAAIAGFYIFKRRRYQAAPTDAPIMELHGNHKSELDAQGRPIVHELYSDDGGNNVIMNDRHELDNR